MENRKDILRRAIVVYAAVFLMALVIIARVVYIQFFQGEMCREKAKEISLRYFNIDPVRGNIYDANGEFLSTTVPVFDVYMDVASPYIHDTIFNENVDSLAYRLNALFPGQTTADYKASLKKARAKNSRYLLIKRNVNFEQLKKLRTFPIFRMGKNRGGLITEVRNQRVNPYKELAYRTIGWDKPDTKNDVGLEGAYSKFLTGQSGRRLYQRIADGNWKALNKDNEIEPQNGHDIVTTIDIHLQDVAETALYKQLVENEANHGCVVVMEVKTGEIKAIANLGLDDKGNYVERQNYAIWECTEPGSTFKLFSLLAAFEDGKVGLNDKVNVTGGVAKYANRTMKDSHLGGGIMTVQEVFEHSSNVGVSKIITQAYSSNPQKFIDRLYSFSVNQPLGLEIEGEISPKIKTTKAKSWSKVSLPWMSIGYEVALTPLQILTFYNAVANDGVMVRPHFVKEIRQGDLVVQKTEPQVINPRIASKQAIEKAKIMLLGVVEQGTGSALKNPVYKVAGKTGTAQIAQNRSGYNKSDYKASFVGYFPADNPKYSCIVVINNPSKGVIYGGAISAPVFREIADRIYATDSEMANEPAKIAGKQSLPKFSGKGEDIKILNRWLGIQGVLPVAEWIRQASDSTGNKAVAFNTDVKSVPNVTGMGAKDALYLLESLGLKVRLSGKGVVRRQSVAPGSAILKGSVIVLEMEV